jgi:hypothetical protein
LQIKMHNWIILSRRLSFLGSFKKHLSCFPKNFQLLGKTSKLFLLYFWQFFLIPRIVVNIQYHISFIFLICI